MRTLSNFLCLQMEWNGLCFTAENRLSPCNKGTRKSWVQKVVCCGISQALFWMRKRAIKIAHFCSRAAEGIAKNGGWTKKENSQTHEGGHTFFPFLLRLLCDNEWREEGWKFCSFQKIIRTADGTNEESDFFIMSIDKVRMDFIMTF